MRWNQLENWSKVMINLGNIHIVGFFGATGSYISESALKKTYQLGMCQSGIMSTVLYGKHCSRCQTLHKKFGLGTEGLYLHKPYTIDVSEEVQVACATHNEELGKIRSLESVKKYLTDCQSVKDKALAGKFGKTAQSRFQYCNLVNLRQMFHYVNNISDYD